MLHLMTVEKKFDENILLHVNFSYCISLNVLRTHQTGFIVIMAFVNFRFGRSSCTIDNSRYIGGSREWGMGSCDNLAGSDFLKF